MSVGRVKVQNTHCIVVVVRRFENSLGSLERHHMVSETSAPRFVFRSRASPACASECEKIQFHVHREEPETAMLTVDSRVFDVCAPKVMCVIKNVWKGIVVG
jgi:hypothetical protein